MRRASHSAFSLVISSSSLDEDSRTSPRNPHKCEDIHDPDSIIDILDLHGVRPFRSFNWASSCFCDVDFAVMTIPQTISSMLMTPNSGEVCWRRKKRKRQVIGNCSSRGAFERGTTPPPHLETSEGMFLRISSSPDHSFKRLRESCLSSQVSLSRYEVPMDLGARRDRFRSQSWRLPAARKTQKKESCHNSS